jgi:hypothetical protein
MKKLSNVVVIACVSYALFYGCDFKSNPVSANETEVNRSETSTTSGVINTAIINNYTVKLDEGKSGYNETDDKTTFSYSVSYNGTGPSSNNFFLEVPECAAGELLAYNPVNSTQYPYDDPTSGTTGILWNSSLSRKTSHFSLTFNGNVSTGMVSATVASGDSVKSREIAGPCKGLIEISGTVFIDTGGEPSGIGNVLVSLKDADNENLISEVRTDVSGWYSFKVVPGTYTLSVPESLAGGTITYTGPPFEAKEFNADSPDNDFPYKADTEAMIQHLENQTILTNTEDTKFWIKVVRTAAIPNSGNTEVPIDDVYEFLKKIGNNEYISGIEPDVFPITPFPFSQKEGAGQANAKMALEILAPPNPNLSDEQLFKKELLAAMLNIVSGRGVNAFNFIDCGPENEDDALCSANADEFHLALLAFGINLFADYFQVSQSQQFSIENRKLSISTTISSLSGGTDVFSTFNRSGTGGLN